MDLLKASLTHVVAVLVVVSLVAASAVIPAQLQPTQQHQHQQQRNRSEPFDSLPPGNDTSSNMTHSSDITTDAISVRCPRFQFFHHHDRKCKPCSSCPVNQIIRRPCTARSDTFCGPFVEFDEFHQRPEQSPPEVDHSSYHKKHKGLHSAISESEAQWRELAIALICVLGAICIVVVIFAVVLVRLRRRQLTEKHSAVQPGASSRYPNLEPRYVQIPVTSRDRLKSSLHAKLHDDVINPNLKESQECLLVSPQLTPRKDEDEEDKDFVYFNLSHDACGKHNLTVLP